MRERKEKYFTINNIIKQAEEMIKQIDNSRAEKKMKFDLKKSALLILDMQKYFLDKSSHAFIPSAFPVLNQLKRVKEFFKKNHRPIIFTRHMNNSHNASMLSLWWNDIIKEHKPMSELNKSLFKKDDMVINKTQYDAFFNTQLDDILKQKKVTQLVVTGVMTNLCCETTARSAFVHGYQVFFPAELTACYNKDFHIITLKNLAYGFASVSTFENLIGKKY